MVRETVGKLATDLLAKEPDTRDPQEQMREQLIDYEKNIFDCVDRSRKDFLGDFYVLVITKKEPLLVNVIRHYFFGRLSCPTPDYDQTLYHYESEHDRLKFMWVIPSRDTCIMLKEHAMSVVPEERGLLNFVLDFADGTLFKKAKELNGETSDSSLLTT